MAKKIELKPEQRSQLLMVKRFIGICGEQLCCAMVNDKHIHKAEDAIYKALAEIQLCLYPVVKKS